VGICKQLKKIERNYYGKKKQRRTNDGSKNTRGQRAGRKRNGKKPPRRQKNHEHLMQNERNDSVGKIIKKQNKMKAILPLTLAAASTILITSLTLHAADTDNRIESSAAKSYVFKTYLKDDSIKTESKDGIVTLTGTVAVESHKSLAENTVASLPGVKRVNNELAVVGEQPAEHSDAWITTKVKTALLFHRNVSGTGTTVYTKDGIVTLQGEVGSVAEKELATEYAQDIDNVKEVKNEMTIAKTPAASPTMSDKIDDASITAQVKSSLMSHHSTSALHTGVSTADGVVTLSGIAKNEAEKSLVTKLATDINGVTSVINNMTIAPPVAAN
jgi:osmotically-inducible protein OsmY